MSQQANNTFHITHNSNFYNTYNNENKFNNIGTKNPEKSTSHIYVLNDPKKNYLKYKFEVRLLMGVQAGHSM